MLLIFFFHGIVFSFLLFKKGYINDNTASKWLSLMVFLYAMYIAPYMLGYAGWYSDGTSIRLLSFKLSTVNILFFIPFMQVLLIGPVVFFYTKSLLNTSFKISKKDYIHFVPSVFYGVYSLIIFIIDKLILEDYYFYADGRDKDLANWYQISGLISMTFYLVLSLRYYFEYRKLVFDKVSYADTLLFKWIRNFMIAFLGILMLRFLFFIFNPEWGNFGNQFWHYLAFSFVFYYITVTGYSNIIKQTTLRHEKLKIVNVFDDENVVSKKDSKINITKLDISIWKDELSSVMIEKKLFENPRLTLLDVANELGTTSKTISSVVNSDFNMNFNDFVNHYRIEAVKDKLNKGEQTTSTLLGIALDCGFNSKATFNRAFKKSTSLSPKAYLDELTKN